LEKLGFPWILSSETRLINGLRGIFAEKFFVTLLPLGAVGAPGRNAAGEATGKRGIVHRASLTQVLIFCKQLSARPFAEAANPTVRFAQIPVVRAASDNAETKARCEGAIGDPDIAVASQFIRVTNSTGGALIPPGGKTGGYLYVHGCTIIFRKGRKGIV
jgi:hypothetical protein